MEKKKDVSQNRSFFNIPSKTPVLETLFNKVAGLKLYWKEIPAQVFSCEYCEILKSGIFTEYLRRLLLLIKQLRKWQVVKSSHSEMKLFWKFTKKQPRNFQKQPFKQLLWERLEVVGFGYLSFGGSFEVYSFCISLPWSKTCESSLHWNSFTNNSSRTLDNVHTLDNFSFTLDNCNNKF